MPRGRAPSPSSWLTRCRSTRIWRSRGPTSFMRSRNDSRKPLVLEAALDTLATTPWSCSSRARWVNGTLELVVEPLHLARDRHHLPVARWRLALVAGVAVNAPQQRSQLELEGVV